MEGGKKKENKKRMSRLVGLGWSGSHGMEGVKGVTDKAGNARPRGIDIRDRCHFVVVVVFEKGLEGTSNPRLRR
jgi:hypothetical protein